MKLGFPSFYPPTEEEYQQLWRDATIILDTNVLLNLYRVPATTRDEIFTALELLKEKLWIPHQVALEYQRNRLTVIASARKVTDEVLTAAVSTVEQLRKRVETLQIEKRGLGLDPRPLLDDLEKANKSLVEAIDAAHSTQPEIGSTDPIRERLDALFGTQVGAGPATQNELDALCQDGERRFSEKIPPGYADAEKERNPNEATYIHNHLKYSRKFGDLIVWRQILDKVKNDKSAGVILVTGDNKEDWWWREHGRTLGPHPELASEIRREAGVSLFWMYSSVNFIEQAARYTSARISEQTVRELQEATASTAIEPSTSSSGSEFDWAIGPVAAWLSSFGPTISHGEERDLITVFHGTERHGYMLMNLDAHILPKTMLLNTAARGAFRRKSGDFNRFSIVLLVSKEYSHQRRAMGSLQQQLRYTVARSGVDGIVVGTIIDDKFQLITTVDRSDGYSTGH